MKSAFYFSNIDMPLTHGHIVQRINALAPRERKHEFPFITDVSSSVCWMENVGLI